ncbi:MAG: hypothetical protein GEU75_06700 [Dehalococcoidia bacterium]|nr:hypothetical protein [Dehalococcoidia bacterium]
MSLSSQLFIRTGGYLYDRLSLDELVEWIQDAEEHWASLSEKDESRRLADTIMLAAYEVQAGARDAASAKDLIRRAALEPATL